MKSKLKQISDVADPEMVINCSKNRFFTRNVVFNGFNKNEK